MLNSYTLKKLALTAILAFLVPVVYGQKLYKDSMYSHVNVTPHKYYTINSEAMEFEFYRANEANGKIPLIVYVHGGGFSSGTQNSPGIQYFAKRLACRGYAVASLSYRLTLKGMDAECEITAAQKKEAIEAGSLDIIHGIKHILDYDSTFSIDSEKIILVGSSAGAETVLNIVYGDYCSDLLSDFKFAGVISMSGALTSLINLTKSRAIPTQLFHGTNDEVVPFNTAPHYFCDQRKDDFLMLYGSETIAKTLKEYGTSYYLYLINGGTHSWAGVPTKNCFDEITDFLYNDVLFPSHLRETERIIQESN